MMRRVVGDSINQTEYFMLRNSADGIAKTGLAWNSAGGVATYVRNRAAPVAITLATQTATGAHSDGGFVEVDSVNSKGLYRLDVPDAAYVSGVDKVVVEIFFTGIFEEAIEIAIEGNSCSVVTDAGNTASTFKTDRTETGADHWSRSFFTFDDDTATVALRGQTRKISAYNGTTKFITVISPFTTVPANGDRGQLINR